MVEQVPPSVQALQEALTLSADMLKDLEMGTTPLSGIALKASRLARLLNDDTYRQLFLYEMAGYPSTPEGVSPDVWKLAVLAQRVFQYKATKDGPATSHAYLESIGQLETNLLTSQTGLNAARDPDVSVVSANPNQWVYAPSGNAVERARLKGDVSQISQRLSSRRALIYEYTLRRHYELKYSSVASDIFSRLRSMTDPMIGNLLPDAVRKFSAVYDNLTSENPEDWSNAVHSCRRILQGLADAVFPPQTSSRTVDIKGKKKEVNLGKENYINRLVCFVEDNSESERFKGLVGSDLAFLGNRLDAIFEATQKGSHANILVRDEADRYVVRTYLIVSDILLLKKTLQHADAHISEPNEG